MSEAQLKMIESVGKLSLSTIAMALVGVMLWLNHLANIDFNVSVGDTMKKQYEANVRQADAMEKISGEWFLMIRDIDERVKRIERTVESK